MTFSLEKIETVSECGGEVQVSSYGQAKSFVLNEKLMRKMASPRTQDRTALMRVARYTIKYRGMTCRYPWTELDSDNGVFWRCKPCWMQLHEKIHSGRCRDVEWSVCEGMVQNCGSLGLEQWRVRIGSGGESSNRRYGTAVDFERLLFVWPRGELSLTQLQDGPPARMRKSPTVGCWRSVGATSCSFRENSSLHNVRTGESERCTNQVSWAGTTVAPHKSLQLGSC